MPKKQELIQKQKEVSAYDKQTVHELFRFSLEWLEKYIEVVYPDYQIRKQIHDNNVKRQDANDPDKVENLLVGSLFGFKATIEIAGKPKILYDEVKQEYYKWLGAVGIDINSCPPRLKHFLFEINEILEGRGDKFEKDIANRKWEINPNSPEYEEAFRKLFSDIQTPLEDARNEYDSLKGKTHKDIVVRNNFPDSGEQAEQVFKQIAGKYDYQGFNFITQKDQQIRNPNYNPLIDDPSEEFLSSSSPTGGSIQSNPQQRSNSEIIQDVRQNPQNWRIDEVITEYNVLSGAKNKELALIHNSAQVGYDGAVLDNNQSVYLATKFNQGEITEINRVLNVSQSPASSSSYYHQQKPSDGLTNTSNQDNNSGKGGIFAIIGIVSILLVASVVVVKKRLGKKVKSR